ncbi:MAG: tetratricopeptide repeat protein [Chthoniobacteraceae bacterium]
MSRPPRTLTFIPALVIALALTGCDQAFQDRAERSGVQADQKAANGQYDEAIPLYESALDGTPKTAETHFKLGIIYEEQLKDPVGAIHHFQRYLAMSPAGPHAKDAQRFLKEDQMKLGAALGNGATVSQEDAKRLKNANLEMQKKIVQLKSDLEAAVKARIEAYKALGKAGGPKPEQTQKPLREGVRTYTVGPGDTLASIARKFYNNSAKWKNIQDANFEPMDGTAKLKPGMVLMVP